MKKSLLITYFFPPKIGGIENYFNNLCLRLPKDKIIVLTEPVSNSENTDRDLPFKIIRHKLFPWPLFRPSWIPLYFVLKRIIKENKIEILQFGHYSNFVTLGRLIKKLTGLPYIVYTHGVDTLLPQKSIFQKKLMLGNLNKADWIIANSQFMKKRLEALGLNTAKIIVVYPALSKEYFSTESDAKTIQEKYGLKENKVLLTVGHIIKRKGQEDVIQALPYVLKEFPNLKYIIVGEGPYRDNLEALISKLCLSDNVIFTGSIEDRIEVKLPFYKTADIFVMPTKELGGGSDVESFGIVYLEAQAAGLPVIASKIGGAPETIVPGETGLLVEPGQIKELSEKIKRLLSNESLRQSMGEKAKKWVEGAFNWDIQAKKVINLLEDIKIEKDFPDHPAISVIMPAYQVEKTIGRCLESVFTQTFKDLEIIVVNDGSTDNLSQSLERYKTRIKLLNQENRGASAARNKGAEIARGKYLFFCDADVILKPDIFEKMIRILEMNRSASFCYCAFRFGWRSFKALPFSRERLKKYNYISTMSLLRKNDFPGFDQNLKRFQDWDLWLNLTEKNKIGIPTNEILFSAPMRSDGISRSINKKVALDQITKKYHL